MRHQNEREEKKNIAIHSMEIKRMLYTHRRDCRSCEKINNEISIPCDKIITCHDKISEKVKKMLSPLMKSTDYNGLHPIHPIPHCHHSPTKGMWKLWWGSIKFQWLINQLSKQGPAVEVQWPWKPSFSYFCKVIFVPPQFSNHLQAMLQLCSALPVCELCSQAFPSQQPVWLVLYSEMHKQWSELCGNTIHIPTHLCMATSQIYPLLMNH